MAAYFPLAMAEMPLLWLDNLPAGCITSWASLSQLFTSNYQATYSRPSNTHHLSWVTMRPKETLRDYTDRFFENRNKLAGVKDDDVIQYYEAGATTIADLMAIVNKLVDTQEAVVNQFSKDGSWSMLRLPRHPPLTVVLSPASTKLRLCSPMAHGRRPSSRSNSTTPLMTPAHSMNGQNTSSVIARL